MTVGIETDLAAFGARLDAAVANVMENFVHAAAQIAITKSIEENVYEKYDPTEYERRRERGGLTDPANIRIRGGHVIVSADGVQSVFEMEVEDVAKDEDGLPVAEIIESGEGYHWENSRIYQWERDGRPLRRPFYEPAEKIMALESSWVEGSFADAVRYGLREHGFDVL